MGCGGSKDEEYPAAVSGVGDASSGKIELFSDESLAMLSVKVKGGKTSYDQCVQEDKRGSSHSIGKAWGMSKSCPMEMRYWKDNEFPKMSEVTTTPYGDISLGDNDSLTLLLATHMPGTWPCTHSHAAAHALTRCTRHELN